MPKVIYVAIDGSQRAIDAVVGDSVMVTAVKHGVPGIVAECGGACTCATCHIYVDEHFLSRVGTPNGLEDEMLELAVSERRSTSRLSCQLQVTDALDGLTVQIPLEQP
jgi:2Fe-2S ferredoxin